MKMVVIISFGIAAITGLGFFCMGTSNQNDESTYEPKESGEYRDKLYRRMAKNRFTGDSVGRGEIITEAPKKNTTWPELGPISFLGGFWKSWDPRHCI